MHSPDLAHALPGGLRLDRISTKLIPSPRVPPSPPTRGLSRATCLAPSRARWCCGKRATRTLGSSSPTPPRPGDGQVFVRPFQFDPLLRALDAALGTIEPLAANGTLEPLVAADLDLVNMFGNASPNLVCPSAHLSLCTMLTHEQLACPSVLID